MLAIISGGILAPVNLFRSCYSNSVSAKGLCTGLKAVRLAPLYCNCNSGSRSRLCLHFNELKDRNFQISAGAAIRKIFREDLILSSCWVAEVRSLLTSYFISCCVQRCSFLHKQHFCLHMGWNTSAMDHVVMRYFFPLPECWFAVRVHERHELQLHDCTAVLPSHGSRHQFCACLGTCARCPSAQLHLLPDLQHSWSAFAKALDCIQIKINPCLLCTLSCLLSSVFGFICRFPARHLESWLVMALDFQRSVIQI